MPLVVVREDMFARNNRALKPLCLSPHQDQDRYTSPSVMHTLEFNPAIDNTFFFLFETITKYENPSYLPTLRPSVRQFKLPIAIFPRLGIHHQKEKRMPTYLTHAFPLPRRLIRIFTVLHDLTPCSPEHLISPSSSHSFLTCLHNLYPFLPFISPPPEFPPSSPTTQFNLLQSQSYSPVKLLEPYNPEDLSSAFTPFAFIADYAVKINDVGDIAEVMKGYDDNQDENDWFERLRDELMKIGGAVVKPAEGAEGGIKPGRVGWYIVVNGDEERNFPGLGEEEEGDDSEGDGREYRLEEELLGKLNKGGEVGNNKGEQQRHK